VTETWRRATVVEVGPARPCCCEDEDEDDCECELEPLAVGDRVLVRFDVGKPIPPGNPNAPLRVVYAEAIPFRVEEE
jgi:hypothetical protein